LTGSRFLRTLALWLALAAAAGAADHQWQTGVWRGSDVKRKTIDFGPGSSSFGRGAGAPTMRAMADVRTYVIETDDLRLELQDVVPVGRRSIDVTVGEPVTFALEKNTVYVRDPNGAEHKLRVTKKTVVKNIR
jgi:hypothetical protein